MAWDTAEAAGSGTDIESTSNASYYNGNFGTNTWGSVTVTTDVAARASGTPNYGWRFKTVTGGNDRRFISRDSTADASLRPALEISYTAPSIATATAYIIQ